MAKFESDIVTPKVPMHLTVTMPGAKRGRSVPISEFTQQQLELVGAEWTADLLEASARPPIKHLLREEIR